MKRPLYIALPIGSTTAVFGPIWLLIAPPGLWLLATLYVPIMAPTLNSLETWAIACACLLLAIASLLCHTLAHSILTRRLGGAVPSQIPLYPFGDAAQVWPLAPTPQREAFIAIAGSAAHLLLAGLGYALWNAQLHVYINTTGDFLLFCNLALGIVNLAPGTPFDGGRLTRAAIWRLLARPGWGIRASLWLGWALTTGLALWGIGLVVAQARFSLETGLSTVAVAALLGLALWRQPVWRWESVGEPQRFGRTRNIVGGVAVGVIVLVLSAGAGSLLPMLNGIYAPGLALSIEPMIELPEERRHASTGTFLLTSVLTQTPIIAGQWVQAQVSPAVELAPPEQIVPLDITPQEQVELNLQFLEESETAAIVVALQLAGYNASMSSEAVAVRSVLPESPLQETLQIGDRITALNGTPITSTNTLIANVRAQEPQATVELTIERDGVEQRLTTGLLPPAAVGEGPRLGVSIQSVGFRADLPFPVRIVPQKIGGGPSAGLMFTLTLYDLLIAEDLTRGRRIAGTGTISVDGAVGPIGGVAQKVAAAEQAGASHFFVPPDNYAAARSAAQRIEVIEIAHVQEAIAFLRELPVTR
jgi:PDZ domain-containing protein